MNVVEKQLTSEIHLNLTHEIKLTWCHKFGWKQINVLVILLGIVVQHHL
jgi:hypothetical protein